MGIFQKALNSSSNFQLIFIILDSHSFSMNEQQQGVLYYLEKVFPSPQLKQMDDKILDISVIPYH